LNIPYIQQRTTVAVAKELSGLFGTEVTIGKINAGVLNRIIIDDLSMDDQEGKEMLKVSRLSAKFDILPLFRGRISVGSVQLFGFNISLNKTTPDAEPNFQFVLDAFAPKDTIQRSSNIDLRINSVLIRRGQVSYDVLSEQETPGKFNPNHIKLYNIVSNISLKAFQSDSINAQIKRFSVDEQSGLEINKLALKVQGNQNAMTIDNFEIDLPGTTLKMDTIRMEYDSLASFNRFVTDVNFSFRLLPSYITLQDISAFVPALENFRERIDLEADVNGTIDQLNCPRLLVHASNHLRIRGDVQFQDLSNPADAFIYGNLSELSADREGLAFLTRNLVSNYTVTPALLERLGNISFNGEITGYLTDLVTYGTLRTDLGTIKGDVKFTSDKEKGAFSYSGGVETTGFELGTWLANDKLGNISYLMDIKSDHYTNRYPHMIMKGVVESLEYSDYQYENITLDGEYKNGGFDGTLGRNDENGIVLLNGKINLSEHIPVFDFHAAIHDVRPHDLKLTPKYENAAFSLKLDANFTGGNIDEMQGTIRIDSVSFVSPEKSYFTNGILITAQHEENKNTLLLQSDFLQGRLEGKYSYQTIVNNVITVLNQYVPSILPAGKPTIAGKNDFTFDITVFNTKLLPAIFDIPVDIYNPSTIKGYFNDRNSRMKIEGYFPRLRYGNLFMESGMILCENNADEIMGRIRFSNHRKSGIVSASLNVQAADDKITTKINWGNDGQTTYSGHVEALASFLKPEEEQTGALTTVIDLKPTNIILNDTIWNIHSSRITLQPELVHVDNFRFTHADRHLILDGYASADMRSSLKLDLKEINIGYVFDIVNLKSVDFNGNATGTATINSAFKNPVMNTRLSVKGFRFNDALLGDLNVYGEWDDDEQGIYLKAKIKEGDIADNDVEGYIFPLKPKSGLDLHIKARNANLEFMREYLDNIASNITGRASGDIHFYGGFKTLNLEGSAHANATFKVDVLNTHFAVNDSIRLTKNEIQFNNVRVSDLQGHPGVVEGYLRHRNLKDLSYRFQINANNMLVMDTKEDPDMPFYGTIYGTGNAVLTGNAESLTVNAAITTNRNSTFVYSLAESANAASNQFIKFVDKTPSRIYQDSISLYNEFELARQRQIQEEEETEADLRLNIVVDATPDATVRIIMDPTSGDYISGQGYGNIRAEFFNKGDIKMFGNYTINQGIYKFSLQEVIRKDFLINTGSSIAFNGDPADATLDIQAVYTVNSASLNDLIPITENSPITRTNVRVNSLMNISGNLDRPTIKLGLELPNEREEIQELVRTHISTEEEINMQTLYLLGIGKFYTPDHLYAGQRSNMMTSVLSSTLSGQLNNIFSQLMDSRNFNVGTNVSTGEKGWTDVEFEAILSAQLLNNRLLINGNFGYRDNPLSENNFVGDFDAQWLLTPSGDLRLKAYNQTNDRFITRTSLTTQGIGILFKRDFDRWSDLFFWNNWRKRKRLVEEQKEDIPEEKEDKN